MKRYGIWLLVVLAWSIPVPGRAQEKKPADSKPLLETWQAAYFEGLKVGHVHTIAVAIKKDGKNLIRTTKTMELVVKRYGSPVTVNLSQTTEETKEGKVRELALTQSLGKDEKLTLTGVAKDGKLLLSTSRNTAVNELP